MGFKYIWIQYPYPTCELLCFWHVYNFLWDENSDVLKELLPMCFLKHLRGVGFLDAGDNKGTNIPFGMCGSSSFGWTSVVKL